jgi:hypothetical protein
MRTAGTMVGSFRLLEARGFRFSDGSEVPVRVLKSLAPGKWAVGIGGRVFAARSDLTLEAGTVLRARVSVQKDGAISLHIGPSRTDPIGVFLEREGLPDDAVLRALANAFLRHQRPLEPAVLRRALRLASKDAGRTDRDAAVLAVMDDKGWDTTDPSTRKVMDLVEYGRDRDSSDRRRRPRDARDDARGLRETIRDSLTETEGGPDPLQVFNHKKGSHGTWIVAPYELRAGEKRYLGTLRLLLDTISAKAVRMVLMVHSDAGNEWSFSMPLSGGKRSLSVYCGPEAARKRTERAVASLAADFRNLGVEVDDIIHRNDQFDGFSQGREAGPMRAIDTVT